MGKANKKRKQIKKIITIGLPYLFSLLALYYTYRIDVRESKEILRIEHTGDYDIGQSFHLQTILNRTRVEVKKKYKFLIQNNSNVDVIINRFTILEKQELDLDSLIISRKSGYNEYIIRNNQNFLRKKLPLALKSMSSIEIYLEYKFAPNKEMSEKIINGILNIENDIIVDANRFKTFVSEVYFKDSLITLYEFDNSKPLVFEVLTSKGNLFSIEYGYFDKLPM